MSTGARAFIEYRETPMSGSAYRDCALRLYCTQLEALQLYDLTGLQGADPAYEVTDLSSTPREEYERLKNDIVITRVLKLEPGPALAAACAEWKGRNPLTARVRAAVAALESLGDGARLVFFLTI